MLLGRDAELERFGGFLERVRGGASVALVILGDPGAGKTALLDHLITTASEFGGFALVQACCLEAESEIPYSGLADVTRPLRGLIDVLPRAQARALQAALVLGPSAAPGPGPAGGDQRFAVAIATLTLLAAAAETGPVIVTVDDAHWLDSASAEALVFTARRLGTEGVGMVFTLRCTEPWPAHFEALPAMGLEGLDADAAAALVIRPRARPVPAEVTMRLWAAAGGNPLALTSLAATLDEAQLLGKAQIPDPLPVGATIGRGFVRRMAGLPQACRDALLVAAAADAPQMDAVAAALGESGLSVADLEAAESRGLIGIRPGGGELAFDHPLLRSAIYHEASPSSLFETSLARLAGQPLSADSALDLLLYLSAAAQTLSWVGELDRAAHLIAELRERTRDALLPGLLSYVLGMSSEIELRRGGWPQRTQPPPNRSSWPPTPAPGPRTHSRWSGWAPLPRPWGWMKSAAPTWRMRLRSARRPTCGPSRYTGTRRDGCSHWALLIRARRRTRPPRCAGSGLRARSSRRPGPAALRWR